METTEPLLQETRDHDHDKKSSLRTSFNDVISYSKSTLQMLRKYLSFIGPGIMISVSYLDPGNYSTSVSGGAAYQYKLLFAIFVSNICAVVLQTLCVKLGSVTGLNLAENCRKHLPQRVNIVIYVLAEISIIATDLAEVIGTAIGLDILFHIPLVYGLCLTIVDVLVILIVYRPNSSMNITRIFEGLVSFFVILTCICFVFELNAVNIPDTREVWKGFLPSKALTEEKGLYLSLAILGATVMPHSLYLGSGIVQTRLMNYDLKEGNYTHPDEEEVDDEPHDMLYTGDLDRKYKPTVQALKYAMNYSIAELVVSLFTIATFVNSAILIVAGSTLSGTPEAEDADLYSIYDMLSKYLTPAAGKIFALALLFSGQSSGIVCTLAGQMVSEGFLHWSFAPWIRRLVTRSIAIVPCIIIFFIVGESGVSKMLNLSQVVLSLLLPFVSAPLIFFTASKKIMRIPIASNVDSSSVNDDTQPLKDVTTRTYNSFSQLDEETSETIKEKYVDFSNSLLFSIIGGVIWAFISLLNIYLIIAIAMGKDVPL